MSQNYQVNYDINVFAEDAVQAIGRFTMAAEQLKKASAPFQKLNQKINNLKSNISSLSKVKAEVFINTKQAELKIDRLQEKLNRLMATAKSLNMTVGAGGGGGAAVSRARAASRSAVATSVSRAKAPSFSNDPVIANWQRMQQKYTQKAQAIKGNASFFGRSYKNDPLYEKYMRYSNAAGRRIASIQHPAMYEAWTNKQSPNYIPPPVAPIRGSRGKTGHSVMRTRPSGGRSLFPNALGYKTLGATPLDVGGMGAVDMLKGMGVAYGLMGIGTSIGNAISDATEYDNIIQTTKNILGSHDTGENFEGRFRAMEHNIRNIGVKTKFTAPEVASASKFLAMAGLNIDEINKSIRPIADIALIADTDIGETADVVTNIMTAYGLGADKMRDIADKMTMTFTMSNTTLPEMAESYKYFASIARANNWSFDETTGMIGVLGDAGLKGSHAGTTIRQLINNLIKPTKGQKAALDRFGVNTKNSDGTLRSPFEIFKDLAAAGAQSSTFDLFRVTAAQGGVSLMQSVEKWNKIIEENRNAAGISSRLAEAKQNTVQGLWAQVTSMFTEGTMMAFESVRPEVVDMLKSVTDWLSTDESRNRIKAFANDIVSFAKVLGEITTQFIGFYEAFRGPILWLLKFQLQMWPVVWTLRVFKSGVLGVLGVIKSFNVISSVTAKIGLFAVTVSRAAKSMFLMNKAAYGNGAMGGIGGMIMHPMRTIGYLGRSGRNGAPINPDVWNRYQNIYGGKSFGGIFSSRPNPIFSQVGIGLGGVAGSLLGYNIGNSINEDYGGLIGGAIGGIGGSLLFTPGVAAALFSNPIGWVAAAGLAIGGAVYYYHQYREKIQECTAANNEFISSTQSINGINYSEHATMADKYLSIVYNKQLDTNRAIGEHINLMREQLGLMKQAEEEIKDATPFKESHKEIFDNANGSFGALSNLSDWVNAVGGIGYNVNDMAMSVLSQPFLNAAGRSEDHLMFNGIDYGLSSKNAYNQIAASRLLYALGRDTSEGSQLRSLIDSYQSRILKAASPEDFFAVIKDLNAYANGLAWYQGSDKWTMRQIGENTMEQNRMGYHYVMALRQGLYDQFMWNNPQTPLANQLSALQAILSLAEKQQEVSDSILEKYLLNGGIDIFNKERYGSFGSDQFMRYFGWYNNQWNSGTYTYMNQQTGKLETITLTAEEARKHFLTFHQQIIDAVNLLSPKIQPYFSKFVNSPIWGYGDQNTIPSQDGQTVVVNGRKYTRTNGKWQSDVMVERPYSDDEMRQMQQSATKNATETAKPSTYKNKLTGADQSNYKSHYSNNTAAPKQVIVKIENLMNVKSIDLTNADNVAVIDNVKQQLTQALIDVVHDFDETYHG